jgi:hypothetical protein
VGDQTYRVMEYRDESGAGVIGWAFLELGQFSAWKASPASRTDHIFGYFVVDGMEALAEFSSMPARRLADYYHTTTELPRGEAPNRQTFVMTSDHPALADDDDVDLPFEIGNDS